MKIAFYLFSILVFSSCDFQKGSNHDEINIEAMELNDKAIKLTMVNNDDSLLLAKNYLEKAIKIQPNYFLAYRNKSLVLKKMGLTIELIENLETLAKLQPENPDNYTALGLILELNGDSLIAMEKYQVADKIYSSILDTLTSEYDPYYSIETNRALNLKYIHKEAEAYDLLIQVKAKLKEPFMKDMIDDFIKMNRQQLLERLK